MKLSRKDFLLSVLTAAGSASLPVRLARMSSQDAQAAEEIGLSDLQAAQKIARLEFSEEELKAILRSVRETSASYEGLRALPIDYLVAPAFDFIPKGRYVNGAEREPERGEGSEPYESEEDIAFASAGHHSRMLAQGRITSERLTGIYLDRLRQYGDKLLCLVTLTADHATKGAKESDARRKAGATLGLLDGVPVGIKDLFAMNGVTTTWGSEPHKSQVFYYDAAVVTKLNEAGCPILGKLSLGALAMGDVWFAGRTKNPWDPERGSSGSSAGSAASTAAGLAAITVGTETLGSIVSPSHRCRVTGLRPTFGSIDTAGAMPLSWTMDKPGPICRTAEDASLLFNALKKPDKPLTRTAPIENPAGLRVAFAEPEEGSLSEELKQALDILREAGFRPIPLKFREVPEGALHVLDVECGASFDAFTRSPFIDELDSSAWPEIFRASRFIAGTEYVQAMRARTLLMQQFEEDFADFDAFVASDRALETLYHTNLTGHPQIICPWGANQEGMERSVSIIGRLGGENTLVNLAHVLQSHTDYHRQRPDLSAL